MIANSDLACIDSHPVARGLATPLLAAAATAKTPDAFLQLALPRVCEAAECDHVSVMRAERGRWQTQARAGSADSAPESLLAEVLDEDTTKAAAPWTAAPLPPHQPRTDLLVVRSEGCEPDQLISLAKALASLLGITLAMVRQRHP